MKHIYCLVMLCLPFMTSFPQIQMVEVSHYIFPEFSRGTVLLKNGTEYNSLLNYNSITEEMIFEDQGKRLAVSKELLDQIDTVFIRDRKFILLNKEFIELVHHSTIDLFVEHKCRVNAPGKPSGYGGTSQTAAITSYSSFYSDGKLYDLKLPEGYVPKPYFYYWLKKNGDYKIFVNMKQLRDLYPDKKEIFKDYLKKQGIKYEYQEGIVQLIEYLENN